MDLLEAKVEGRTKEEQTTGKVGNCTSANLSCFCYKVYKITMHVVYMTIASLQQTPIDAHALVYGNITEIVLIDK